MVRRRAGALGSHRVSGPVQKPQRGGRNPAQGNAPPLPSPARRGSFVAKFVDRGRKSTKFKTKFKTKDGVGYSLSCAGLSAWRPVGGDDRHDEDVSNH